MAVESIEEGIRKTRRDRGPVLAVENLAVAYKMRHGQVHAVRDISFKIDPGETLGLVGESGCGKTTVALAIIGFLGRNGAIVGGSIRYEGEEMCGKSKEALRRIRGDRISMVYQDPSKALNPCLRIGKQLSEAILEHQEMRRGEAYDRCVRMLKRVYMPNPDDMMNRYPHQLSGGQQQRVVIAMALLNNPALLIMDEPTTALDVTVEAAVLDLIDDLREEFNTAILYITHDLGIIARVSDDVCVTYAGQTVELGTVEQIFNSPQHPYTRGLMRCVPRLGLCKETSRLYPIRGRVPSPSDLPSGCTFEPRCSYAGEQCLTDIPALRRVGTRQLARCHFAGEIDGMEWEPPEDLLPDTIQAPVVSTHRKPILKAREIKTYYEQESSSLMGLFGVGKNYVKAVDGVDLDIPAGSTVGLVGESGCGKTTLARTLIGLESAHSGEVEFLGFDLTKSLEHRDMEVVKELQMVFQNPDSTLNPSFAVGFQIERSLRKFRDTPSGDLRAEVSDLLNAVRLDASYYGRLPRQLSGGEKQRVGIARAFATHPELVLCDEPVSSLDVSVQAAVLNLLMAIQNEHKSTLLFIAHDLSVVRFICDHIVVMYLGKICEIGPAERVYSPPYHPYTEALLSAVPIPDPNVEQRRIRLSGRVPSALNPPRGCRFHTRCPRKLGEICETTSPECREASNGHRIFCHIPLAELSEIEPVVTTTDDQQVATVNR